MIAAGTSAPIAIAAKATPTNQDGNMLQEQRRHREFVPYCLKPAAYPALSARRPRSP